MGRDDIQPLIVDALSQVLTLKPVSIVYNEGNDRTRFGFIAEDTAAIDPHLATYNASGTVSGIDDRAILSILVAALKELIDEVRGLAQSVASFAESFTTKELSFERGTGESLTLTRELCFADGANDTSPLCLTKSQVSALLSQTAGAATSISVPSSPSEIDASEPPISVSSTSTPDTASATPEEPAAEPDSEPQTEEISSSAAPDAANDSEGDTADQPDITQSAPLDQPQPSSLRVRRNLSRRWTASTRSDLALHSFIGDNCGARRIKYRQPPATSAAMVDWPGESPLPSRSHSA